MINLKKIFILVTLILTIGSFSYAIDVSGTYIGKECQNRNCKTPPLSGILDGAVTSILGGTKFNVFLVTNVGSGKINIFWPKKGLQFTRVVLNAGLGFKASPSNGANTVLEGFFEDLGDGEIRLRTSFKKGSMGSEITYYNTEISSNDVENKKRLGSQEDIDQIKLEKDELTAEVARLKKELSKPVRIDTKNLPNNVTVSEDVNLRSRPSVDSKKITVIKKGSKINNLIELPPSRKWSFVATGDGLIGYMQSAFIVNRPSDGQAPLQPTTIIDGSEAISITLPKWDSGLENQQITLKAAGFVTLKGQANINNLDKVIINGKETNLNDSLFGTVMQVKSGNNRIKVEAIETSGKSHTLEFNIKAP